MSVMGVRLPFDSDPHFAHFAHFAVSRPHPQCQDATAWPRRAYAARVLTRSAMPRLPRYAVPGVPQHVIQRGNNRTAIFAVAADYAHFRRVLRSACERHACLVHAYVLMTNHVHLLITPTTPRGIGRVMQSVGRRYVQHFNTTYARTGTLWEGRYRATPVETERYLLTCYRYIEQNPVRAGLVPDPAAYRWSSFRANALGAHDPLVTAHDLYLTLGPDAPTRRRAYQALFAAPLGEPTLQVVRHAVQTGWALGGNRFRREISRLAGRRANRLRTGRRRNEGQTPIRL